MEEDDLQQFRRYMVDRTVYVIAYCLMPNHYHFLIYLREIGLSEKMGLFSLSYTKAINMRHKRCGAHSCVGERCQSLKNCVNR